MQSLFWGHREAQRVVFQIQPGDNVHHAELRFRALLDQFDGASLV
jgi:hypothetical protein